MKYIFMDYIWIEWNRNEDKTEFGWVFLEISGAKEMTETSLDIWSIYHSWYDKCGILGDEWIDWEYDWVSMLIAYQVKKDVVDAGQNVNP